MAPLRGLRELDGLCRGARGCCAWVADDATANSTKPTTADDEGSTKPLQSLFGPRWSGRGSQAVEPSRCVVDSLQRNISTSVDAFRRAARANTVRHGGATWNAAPHALVRCDIASPGRTGGAAREGLSFPALLSSKSCYPTTGIARDAQISSRLPFARAWARADARLGFAVFGASALHDRSATRRTPTPVAPSFG